MAGGWQGWGQKDHNGIAVDRVCLACGIRAEKVSGCVYDNHYTETPDGERLARLEVRVEHLEVQNSEIREEIHSLRAEHREDYQRLQESLQQLETRLLGNFQRFEEAQRSRADKQFLWVLGIVITMWVSIIALGATAVITVLNRLGA
jgi:hypothetical protein